MTASQAIKIVHSKASEAPSQYRSLSLAAAMYWAAVELWNAEYASWKALSDLFGIDSPAARCAWERRSSYSELACVLMYAW